MPCIDGRENWSNEQHLKSELDQVTDMLCSTLNYLKQNHIDLKLEIYNGLSLEIKVWHKKHRKIDIQTKKLGIRDLESKQQSLEIMKQKLIEEIKEIENE